MDESSPAGTVAAFAALVRNTLADVGGTLSPRWARRDDPTVRPSPPEPSAASARGGAKHLAMVIMGAAAPFAPTSHARARLLRQAHASGLFTVGEVEQARRAIGAPHA